MTIEALRAELAAIRELVVCVPTIATAVEALQREAEATRAHVSGIPLIGQCIDVLQRDMRMGRAAVKRFDMRAGPGLEFGCRTDKTSTTRRRGTHRGRNSRPAVAPYTCCIVSSSSANS